jgi:hypothetical protein
MNMVRRTISVLAVVAAMGSVVRGQGPATTTASGRSEVVEADLAKDAATGGTQVEVAKGTLRLKLVEGVSVPSVQDLNEVSKVLRWNGGGALVTGMRLHAVRYNTVGGEVVLTYVVTAPEAERPANADAERGRAALVDGFRAILTQDASLSTEQHAARLKEVEGRLNRVRQMREVLKVLTQSQPSRAGAMGERVKALRAERDRLEMAKVAREARVVALRQGIEAQRQAVEARKKADAVAEELRMVLKLREQAAKQVDAMNTQGLATPTDVAEARAKAAEARVRLAEREATAGRRGEVLDRLADEIAMAEVDMADVEIQLMRVSERLEQVDPARATTQGLERLVEERAVPTGGVPPLDVELIKEERELVRENVVLQVEEVREE